MDNRSVLKSVGWLSSLITRRMDQLCAARKLSGAEGRILHFVMTIDHDIFQKDIEFDSHLKASTVSEILKSMEQKGLIRRESVAHDARLKKIVPTEKVAKLKEEVMSDMTQLDRDLTEGISDSELKMFGEVCLKLIGNLKKLEERK